MYIHSHTLMRVFYFDYYMQVIALLRTSKDTSQARGVLTSDTYGLSVLQVRYTHISILPFHFSPYISPLIVA